MTPQFFTVYSVLCAQFFKPGHGLDHFPLFVEFKSNLAWDWVLMALPDMRLAK